MVATPPFFSSANCCIVTACQTVKRQGRTDMSLPGFFKGTEMPTAGWWEALWPDPATVLKQVGIRTGMIVIDLCCGDGWFTLQIAKIVTHVVAVDIDATHLEVAKLRLAESG